MVIATEKKLPDLLKASTIQKINNLTDNIGVVYSGLNPDSRVLVAKGRKLAQQYLRTYKEPIPISMIVKKLANVMQEYTQSGYVAQGTGLLGEGECSFILVEVSDRLVFLYLSLGVMKLVHSCIRWTHLDLISDGRLVPLVRTR